MAGGSPTEMRSRSRPQCYLCASRGEILFRGLRDRLFGAPGSWTLRRCPRRECGLIWLDPMPVEEEIHRAYASYFTHGPPTEAPKADGQWTQRRGLVLRTLRFLPGIADLQRDHAQRRDMYLADVAPGRLLEVGCGNGSILNQLRSKGWRVEGQEVDARAAAVTRTIHGIPVHVGPLEDLGLAEGSYDAVIMSHVIEHVHDPVALLRECKRILRPGGRLVLVTPNVQGFGFRLFGPAWLGLDPPRHLHLFSRRTLEEMGSRAGFEQVRTLTTEANSLGIIQGSLALSREGAWSGQTVGGSGAWLVSKGLQAWMSLQRLIEENSGEECVLRATRPSMTGSLKGEDSVTTA